MTREAEEVNGEWSRPSQGGRFPDELSLASSFLCLAKEATPYPCLSRVCHVNFERTPSLFFCAHDFVLLCGTSAFMSLHTLVSIELSNIQHCAKMANFC